MMEHIVAQVSGGRPVCVGGAAMMEQIVAQVSGGRPLCLCGGRP